MLVVIPANDSASLGSTRSFFPGGNLALHGVDLPASTWASLFIRSRSSGLGVLPGQTAKNTRLGSPGSLSSPRMNVQPQGVVKVETVSPWPLYLFSIWPHGALIISRAGPLCWLKVTRGNLARLNAAFLHRVGHLGGDHAGFARTLRPARYQAGNHR